MRIDPTYGNMVVPSELNACAKVKRLLAVRAGPSIEIKGFETTWTVVMPEASTNKATKNKPNSPCEDAGMNNRQPTVMVSRPATADRIYPMRRTSSAAGSEMMKYAAKNADCTSITSP